MADLNCEKAVTLDKNVRQKSEIFNVTLLQTCLLVSEHKDTHTNYPSYTCAGHYIHRRNPLPLSTEHSSPVMGLLAPMVED